MDREALVQNANPHFPGMSQVPQRIWISGFGQVWGNIFTATGLKGKTMWR